MTFSPLKAISLLSFFLIPIAALNAQTSKNDTLSLNYAALSKKGDAFLLKAGKGKESLLIFKENLPKMYNMAIEFDVLPKNSDSKFGVISRYQNKGDWTYVGCDLTSDILTNSHWYAGTPGKKKEIAVEISKFYKNYKRHVRIEYVDKSVAIYLDGEQITRTTASLMGNQPGYVGFRAHDGAEVEISNVEITPVISQTEKIAKTSSIKLGSDKMEVIFSKDYPAVYQYRIKEGNILLPGAKKVSNGFVINGKTYAAKTKVVGSPDKVVYQSEIPEINVGIRTEFTLRNMTLEMKVTRIEERGNTKVKTIAFPNHDLVSMNNKDAKAMLSIANNVHSDEFMPLANRSADTTAGYAAIAILNNDKIAATVDNNSTYNARQILYRTAKVGKEFFTSLYSNEWIYRGINNELLPLPEMKIIFSKDSNGNQIVDWQDAAYVLAQAYPEPYGADLIRNSYATITMNFASGGQYPFMRQLDNIKKFSLATDGFGQMLELKGYQSEGHDSGHPDYAGNYNRRAGGLADLQYLTEKSKLYNAHIGVHINHSEAYPEAKAYDAEIITDIPGWAWLDQAYLINKEVDIKRGTFAQRIDQMKTDLPNLAFVYIDTYREHRSIANFTSKHFNKNGWPIWTEDPEIFYREAIWTHYPPESKSLISRFVQHKFRDGYAEHPLLMGGYSRGAEIGFMGWQKGRDFNQVLHNFFTKQLPYRFLMYHALKNINDTKASFEGNVVSESINGIHKISQNGHLIKDGDNLFIPWNPVSKDKIYHYNTKGGSSSWTLPESWKSTGTVSLYKLTAQGNEWLADLPITAQREITITAEPKQGYVLYQKKISGNAKMTWGAGGLISNPGFDGGLSGWNIKGKDVQISKTNYGQDVLQMAGTANVSQVLKLEKGTAYTLSVWVKVEGAGKAVLSIGDESYSITESTVTNFTDNTDRYKTNFQRIKIPFVYEGGSSLANMFFKGGEGSSVQFDDVRIVKMGTQKKTEHAYFEDFEDVDEGWGPFIASKPSLYKTHLSERHDGYTEDTIDGNFSLKTWQEGNGEVYRTSTSMIRFKPNNTYKIKFDYKSTEKGIFRLVVRSKKDNKELINVPLEGNSVFSGAFTTGKSDDYYISTTKKGNGILIIDNFSLDGSLDK
ncbi:endo-alpha-N-acetylgalactosaminidase family protein [Pedobacter sp. PLR]|uniref:endo-alpha-N-acetylgalactosaminidase family protein n=1 Tax=Pedobacter sp. PLR TaxID=2994465 RepID=UPI0022471547|nr:endo-alpha-N-acetylgalactosaminidase family protein [Pedobacter sp. PLR]MCX2452529.1 endo-alpha-N-acetylgalactosaminidase family protein [Pedobacter sp. PLR]